MYCLCIVRAATTTTLKYRQIDNGLAFVSYGAATISKISSMHVMETGICDECDSCVWHLLIFHSLSI